jgi:hypothetical protein
MDSHHSRTPLVLLLVATLRIASRLQKVSHLNLKSTPWILQLADKPIESVNALPQASQQEVKRKESAESSDDESDLNWATLWKNLDPANRRPQTSFKSDAEVTAAKTSRVRTSKRAMLYKETSSTNSIGVSPSGFVFEDRKSLGESRCP